MTRAKKRLYLTAAVQRRLYGGESFNLPSRFLEEVPSHLLKRIEAGAAPHPSSIEALVEPGPRYETEADREPFVDFYQPGIRVRHPEWGVGTIKERIGSGEEMKVVVTFVGIGTKKLKVKYAHLTRA
jgi:DNA helicase-2/ATP-dependent DNA helicase PcrA